MDISAQIMIISNCFGLFCSIRVKIDFTQGSFLPKIHFKYELNKRTHILSKNENKKQTLD